MAKIYKIAKGDEVSTTGTGIISVKTGFLQKVYDTEVTGSAVTSIDITNLDINTDKMYLILFFPNNTSASTSGYSLFINNDTTVTNYYRQEFYCTGGTLNSSNNNDALFAHALAGGSSIAIGWLIRDGAGNARCLSHLNHSLTTTLMQQNRFLAKTATVANITQITLTAGIANAIGIGSRLIIYKVSV